MSAPKLTAAQRRVLEQIHYGEEPSWRSSAVRRLYVMGLWVWDSPAGHDVRVLTPAGRAALEGAR